MRRLAGWMRSSTTPGSSRRRCALDAMDAARIARVLATNVVGPFICAREAVRRMSTKYGGRGGAIVNVSSGAARLGSPGEYVDYAASKGALNTMTIGLSREVAEEGIRVNAVRPGTSTPSMHASGGEPNRIERVKDQVPMKRGGTAGRSRAGPFCGCCRTRRPTSTGRSSTSPEASDVSRAARLSILILVMAVCGGCSDGCSNNSSTSPSGAGSASLRFQASPISMSAIRYIMPLGYMSVGQMSPAHFISFYFANPDAGESPVAQQTVVFAPGAGVVLTASSTPGVGGTPDTGGIQVQGAGHLVYTLRNIIPDPAIVSGTVLVAGQRVGVTGSRNFFGGSSAVDLEVMDNSSSVITPTTYQPPLQFYDEPVRSQLYGRVQRLGLELDGRYNYDMTGRLSGQWVWQGGTLPYPIYFVYDTYDPAQPRFGLSWPFGSGSSFSAGVFAIGPGEPDPASVSVASGPVRYTLTRSRTGLPLNAGPGGAILVQMLTDTSIRAEWFPDTTSASSFTANSFTFARTFCPPRSIPPC